MLRRTRQVGLAGVALLGKTWWLLLAARLALRWVPVKKIVAWKQRPLVAKAHAADAAGRVRWAVLVAARYSPVEFVCFPQCLAAAELLRGQGIASRLHYGVKREGDKLLTHTWLEADGEMVIGGEVAGEFSELDVY